MVCGGWLLRSKSPCVGRGVLRPESALRAASMCMHGALNVASSVSSFLTRGAVRCNYIASLLTNIRHFHDVQGRSDLNLTRRPFAADGRPTPPSGAFTDGGQRDHGKSFLLHSTAIAVEWRNICPYSSLLNFTTSRDSERYGAIPHRYDTNEVSPKPIPKVNRRASCRRPVGAGCSGACDRLDAGA